MKTHTLIAITFAVPLLARADDTVAGELHAIDHFELGRAEQRIGRTTDVAYDNTVNFTGYGFAQGSATNQSGNTLTRMAMDDLTPNGISGDVTSFRFSVANTDGSPVTARARVRFWNADGEGGKPGTYYSDPAAVGFTFNSFAFSPRVTVVSASIAPGLFTMPTGAFWAGLTFDDDNGATGTSLSQMNSLGQGVFDPPVVGSSADRMFLTYDSESFFGVDNPAGGLSSFGGGMKANLGWEFEVVPEPSTLLLLAMGATGMIARRQRVR